MIRAAHHRTGIVRGAFALTMLASATVWLLAGCATQGRLHYVAATVAPVPKDTTLHDVEGRPYAVQTWRPMFSDTLIGIVPGTGDSTKRYLGRLRGGYTADTLNLILFGDNRPGWRMTRLAPEYAKLKQGFSLNPVKLVTGIAMVPVILVKGLYPDLALIRDAPHKILNTPNWGREHQVMSAIMERIDSLKAHDQSVACIVNSGDLVEDGRIPAHWERFLKLNAPLTTRTPYFPIAGNHERTDTPNGVENWRTATGLPVTGDRLYYCFDTADGWLRVIALDTNPIVDPGSHWTRELQIKYSDEQFTWLVQRVKEHRGPVIVLMHHPPFSTGFHRDEWQHDSVLVERRARMVRALHEAGIAVIVSGHEHAYQRALMTWPDAVLISIVAGGGGAPLHDIPPQPEAAQMYAEYKVAGGVIKPENVVTSKVFNYVLLRLWFGGGEMYAYSVDANAKQQLIDKVQIDLERYGKPKIDQHKIPVPPAKGPSEPMANETTKHMTPASKADSVVNSARILSKPPPGKKTPLGKRPLRR